MANLETKYLGLTLKNPIVVSSCGLTNSTSSIQKLVKAGAGAIVLKSLFEEQINHDINNTLYKAEGSDYPEALDLIRNYTRDNSVNEYLTLIQESKKAFDIPIIASINCYSSDEWISFAKDIEAAGADAIELNIFMVNTDKNGTSEKSEDTYYQIVNKVSQTVKIPVSIKLGLYFTNLVSTINKLSVSGAKGVVLFNRFYEPDININKLSLNASEVLSSPSDMSRTLRWVAITSGKINNIDFAASTGIHTGEAVIKQLLAGANVVQVCSAIYKNGPSILSTMLTELEAWMTEKEYTTIGEFRGKMNYKQIENPSIYERSQFMKYFSSYE